MREREYYNNNSKGGLLDILHGRVAGVVSFEHLEAAPAALKHSDINTRLGPRIHHWRPAGREPRSD